MLQASDSSSACAANKIKRERGVNAGPNTVSLVAETEAKAMREPLSFCWWAGEFERDKIPIYGLGPEQNQCLSRRCLHESMFPRRETPRTVIWCPVERSSHRNIIPGDYFVRCRDYNIEVHPRAVGRGGFKKPAHHEQVIPDRNIIFPDKSSRANGHSPHHHCDAGMGCDTLFGRVIGHEPAHEPLHRDRFRHRTKAALPKNGFAFASKNIIAGIGQFQNTVEQIYLNSSAVDPKWMRYHR